MNRSLLCLLLVFFSGCCATPPKPSKYFDRSSAAETARFFQYAVETKQYQDAYECLDIRSRERISATAFATALRWAKIEALDGNSLWRVIAEAFRVPKVEQVPEDPTARWVTLVHFKDEDTYEMSLRISPEDGEWRIDISRMRGFEPEIEQ